jgi:hypothetical protein
MNDVQKTLSVQSIPQELFNVYAGLRDKDTRELVIVASGQLVAETYSEAKAIFSVTNSEEIKKGQLKHKGRTMLEVVACPFCG